MSSTKLQFDQLGPYNFLSRKWTFLPFTGKAVLKHNPALPDVITFLVKFTNFGENVRPFFIVTYFNPSLIFEAKMEAPLLVYIDRLVNY